MIIRNIISQLQKEEKKNPNQELGTVILKFFGGNWINNEEQKLLANVNANRLLITRFSDVELEVDPQNPLELTQFLDIKDKAEGKMQQSPKSGLIGGFFQPPKATPQKITGQLTLLIKQMDEVVYSYITSKADEWYRQCFNTPHFSSQKLEIFMEIINFSRNNEGNIDTVNDILEIVNIDSIVTTGEYEVIKEICSFLNDQLAQSIHQQFSY